MEKHIIIISIILIVFLVAIFLILKSRNMHIWISSYIIERINPKKISGNINVYF